MKSYDSIAQMRKQLAWLNTKLNAKQKEEIAKAEGIGTTTLRNYLTGSISVLALASSIIERGGQMVEDAKKEEV